MRATVGGQALDLDRAPQRWGQAAGVVYGVTWALGVEIDSPLAGEGGHFGQMRDAVWRTLTRHLRTPHAPTPPLSAWDALGAFAAESGLSLEGVAALGWEMFGQAAGSPSLPPPFRRGWGGGRSPAGHSPASGPPSDARRSWAWANWASTARTAATPRAVQVGAFWAPVQFRRVSGGVLEQSTFELLLSRPASADIARATERTLAARPTIEKAAHAEATA